MSKLPYSKICEIEDFSSPELIELIRDAYKHHIKVHDESFPVGAEYRKYWEIAMSIRSFKDLGVLNRQSKMLGVGAGTEVLNYYLTNHVGQVFATDLYLLSGEWNLDAPQFMLYSPDLIAPYEYEKDRLVVQHMDGRKLNYPDETFDGIFSSSSIEHFGSLNFIANTAYEMGRVLKPGGVLTLSTEYLIFGPSGQNEYPSLHLFKKEEILHSIIEASGLEQVGELSWDVSDATLETKRALELFVNDRMAQPSIIRSDEVLWSKYPHIILDHDGNIFTSIHLTLKKTQTGYPITQNEWAKPDNSTQEAIQDIKDQITRRLTPKPPESENSSHSFQTNYDQLGEIINDIRINLMEYDRVSPSIVENLRGVNKIKGVIIFFRRTIRRIINLGKVWALQRQLFQDFVNAISIIGEKIDK